MIKRKIKLRTVSQRKINKNNRVKHLRRNQIKFRSQSQSNLKQRKPLSLNWTSQIKRSPE
jgi:hypothetical protein